MNYKTIKVDIDEDVWRIFGIIAAAKGEYKRDLLNEVLRAYIERERANIDINR